MATTINEMYDYYSRNKDSLVAKYNNKYIVIHNNEVVGAYDNESDAYMCAVRDYGLGNFFMHHCMENEQPLVFQRVSFV